MNKDNIKYKDNVSDKPNKEHIKKDALVTDQVVQGEKKEHETSQKSVKEINGPKGLEPTRYGDWESKGRCYDF